MIFIEGNFPSFKNSKQMTKSGFLVMSKTVRKYLKEYEWQWKDDCPAFEFGKMTSNKERPFMVGMHFVRGTKHKYDWVNMVQGVQDLMVKYEWIEDDNTDVMFPVPLMVHGHYSSYDKLKPGVYIKIMNQ